MKNYKDQCIDELFSGLINPNLTLPAAETTKELSSSTVEDLTNDNMLIASEGNELPKDKDIKRQSFSLSTEKSSKKSGRKKTNKVSFLARISKDKIEKLNWLSNSFGIHKSDIIEEGLAYYFSKFEEKHGPINPSNLKTAADLIS